MAVRCRRSGELLQLPRVDIAPVRATARVVGIETKAHIVREADVRSSWFGDAAEDVDDDLWLHPAQRCKAVAETGLQDQEKRGGAVQRFENLQTAPVTEMSVCALSARGSRTRPSSRARAFEARPPVAA